MCNIYSMLKNLINNKYYSTKEEVIDTLNVFFAYNVITEEQYTELMELTKKMYPDESKDDSGKDTNTDSKADETTEETA